MVGSTVLSLAAVINKGSCNKGSYSMFTRVLSNIHINDKNKQFCNRKMDCMIILSLYLYLFLMLDWYRVPDSFQLVVTW